MMRLAFGFVNIMISLVIISVGTMLA